MKKIKKIANRTINTVKSFTQAPIENLGFLIPVVMAVFSVICALVGYVLFIVRGGYSNQVSLIKEFGKDGISQGFTSGSAGILTSGSIPKVIWILFFIQMVLMLISYFKNVGKAKRIIMIIDLVIIALVIALFVFVFIISMGLLFSSEEQLMSAISQYESMKVNLKVLLITYGVFAVVSFIIFMVLILISECRWMLGYGMLSLGVNYIATPLVVLLLENIIPLVAGILFLAIIGAVLWIGFKVFIEGGEEGSSSSSSSVTSVSTSSTIEAKVVNKQQYQEVKKYDLKTTFYRDKGGYGITTPQADCIYFKDTWGNKKYSCTVNDFEKGKVAIINKGSRIMNIVGCKTPER